MVGLAQLAEHRIVVPGVVGSSPISHPTKEERPAAPASHTIVTIEVTNPDAHGESARGDCLFPLAIRSLRKQKYACMFLFSPFKLFTAWEAGGAGLFPQKSWDVV